MMLNLMLGEDTCTEIRTLLADFRRVQVSRFPIDVKAAANDHNVIVFIDSRFPNDIAHYKRNLAVLAVNGVDDKGRKNFVLRSRLIENPKYALHNDDYYSRETTDVKKMAKFLRDYVKPYSPQEIAKKSGDVSSDYYEWQQQARMDFRRVAGQVSEIEIAEEVAYLKSVGVQFRSEKFRDIAERGVELLDEFKRRKDAQIVHAHVYMHPDDSVSVTTAEDKSYSFDSIDAVPECIRQQVAMLMMVEMKQYVPEVGKRVGDKMFWVHVNTDIFNDSNS